MSESTIYALSSGALPSGVAVLRISGSGGKRVLDEIVSSPVKAKHAQLSVLIDPSSGEKLDQALVLYFPAPSSFTGEDVVELHCHGGVASVAAVLRTLSELQGFRAAEPGEFSRRAFENGKLDLTQLEGLSDIIAANTEEQRKQALRQTNGALRDLYDDWRTRLIRARALIEAELDFADEDDVPGSVSDQVWQEVEVLAGSIRKHLDDQNRGEIVRRGLRIALMGKPNAGKSSLLNALAKREIAIVTPQAGTTRDVLEASLDLEGHFITLFDTAGIRQSDNLVEQEGIKRARVTGETADMVLWLHAADDDSDPEPIVDSKIVISKSDLGRSMAAEELHITTQEEDGLSTLLEWLRQEIKNRTSGGEDVLLTRQRHREALQNTISNLDASLAGTEIEIRSENLRLAADHLGRLTGRIDVEDLLDVIFSEFCVGK